MSGGRTGVKYARLYVCPICGKRDFTAPGLCLHRCPRLPIIQIRTPMSRAVNYHQRINPVLVDREIRNRMANTTE